MFFFVFLLAICEPEMKFFFMLGGGGVFQGFGVVVFRQEDICSLILSFWKEIWLACSNWTLFS